MHCNVRKLNTQNNIFYARNVLDQFLYEMISCRSQCNQKNYSVLSTYAKANQGVHWSLSWQSEVYMYHVQTAV